MRKPTLFSYVGAACIVAYVVIRGVFVCCEYWWQFQLQRGTHAEHAWFLIGLTFLGVLLAMNSILGFLLRRYSRHGVSQSGAPFVLLPILDLSAIALLFSMALIFEDPEIRVRLSRIGLIHVGQVGFVTGCIWFVLSVFRNLIVPLYPNTKLDAAKLDATAGERFKTAFSRGGDRVRGEQKSD